MSWVVDTSGFKEIGFSTSSSRIASIGVTVQSRPGNGARFRIDTGRISLTLDTISSRVDIDGEGIKYGGGVEAGSALVAWGIGVV